MDDKVEPLSDEDLLRLEEQRIWVRDHYNSEARHKFETIDGKLRLIDTILKEGWITSDETWKLQSLGVVLGDALIQSQGFMWIMVEDEYGRDPAVCIPGTTIKLHCPTMISKRVEDAEDFNVYDLFEDLCERVAELKKEFPAH